MTSSVAGMDEQRVRGAGPPQWWRHGPPGLHRWVDEQQSTRWPWRSTAAAHLLRARRLQLRGAPAAGERAALDPFARALLLVGSVLLLWRLRHPVAVVFGTAAAAMVYLGAGLPVRAGLPHRRAGLLQRRRRRAPAGRLGRARGCSGPGICWSATGCTGGCRRPGRPGGPWGAGDRRRRLGGGDRRASRNWPAPGASSGPGSGPSGRRPRGGGPTRSGCGSPANCTTSSRTASPSSTSRRASASRCSTPTPSRPAPRSPPSRPPARRRWARSARSSTRCAPPATRRAPRRPASTGCPNWWSRRRARG